jgi:hypothetical protein
MIIVKLGVKKIVTEEEIVVKILKKSVHNLFFGSNIQIKINFKLKELSSSE